MYINVKVMCTMYECCDGGGVHFDGLTSRLACSRSLCLSFVLAMICERYNMSRHGAQATFVM